MMQNEAQFRGLMQGKTVLLTGGGGGIGAEAARAFAAMGARVILAEVQAQTGRLAQQKLCGEFGAQAAVFYEVDLAEEAQVRALAGWVLGQYGVPDVVFNNATITKMGAVDEVETAFWDHSYAVNLKAPLLLAQLFLPQMKARGRGALVFVSSSGASPYMGAYEVFKTAQVELSNTLAMELEGTGVLTYTVGPGLVKTQTAMAAIETVAKNMGMTTDEFYRMNSQHILSAEQAGWGFALSAAFAPRYHGQEIGCIQVLMDCDALPPEPQQGTVPPAQGDSEEQQRLLARVQTTLEEQYAGWQKMNVFERQWVLRDFKKMMALSAEQAVQQLQQISGQLAAGKGLGRAERQFLEKLQAYWQHQLALLKGYEKDKKKLEQNAQIITGWAGDIAALLGQG